MDGWGGRGEDSIVLPRRILAVSALALSGLFCALVVAQGRTLSPDQLQGLSVAALVAAAGALLVAQATTFASAARWYIALLAIGLLGTAAAALVRDRPGDALGLVSCVAAALGCAAGLVRTMGRRKDETFVASQGAVPALRRLARRIEAETRSVVVELPGAQGPVRRLLTERLGQLAGQLRFAEGWSRRLGIGDADPVRRKLSTVRAQIAAQLQVAAYRRGR